MLPEPTLLGSLDDLFDGRRHRAEAELKLAFVRRYDDLVTSFEALSTAGDLSAVEVAAWRTRHRSEYRRCVGVEIELRDELVRRLEEVVCSGSCSVAVVIADINRTQRNNVSLSLSPDMSGEDRWSFRSCG